MGWDEIMTKNMPKTAVIHSWRGVNEGFEKTAMDLSISETAIAGGDLGWVNENLMTNNFKSEVVNQFHSTL